MVKSSRYIFFSFYEYKNASSPLPPECSPIPHNHVIHPSEVYYKSQSPSWSGANQLHTSIPIGCYPPPLVNFQSLQHSEGPSTLYVVLKLSWNIRRFFIWWLKID